MDESLRLRVDSCHSLIHDVSQRLEGEDVHPRIKDQLKRLDELLCLIDAAAMTDQDLQRIEDSTNQLMHELSLIFSHQELGPLYRLHQH